MGELDGKVAMVTGAGRGIGRATALRFAREGAVVICCSRTAAQIEETAALIRQAGGQVAAIVANVGDEAEVDRLFATLAQFGGRLDVLVNNAATLKPQPLMEMSVADWDATLAVNLRGAFLCGQRAMWLMAAQSGGAIINLGSLSGVANVEKFPGLSAYNVSKYGILGLTEIMAVEGKPYHIRVNAVSPGAVDTQMLREAAPHLRTSTTPADIADTILYLASDRAHHLNGANIIVFSNELSD